MIGDRNQKILALEGLRGLMAWWVVLGHIAHTIGSRNFLLLHNGLAVDVFIILSGFVIFRLIDTKQERYGPYLIRRAFRLFPLYLIVLCVSAALLPIFVEAMRAVPFDNARNSARLLQAQAALASLPLHFWLHVPLAQGLVPEEVLPAAAYTIVGQAWSMSLEWQFYILAPFAAAVVATKRALKLVLPIAALVIVAPLINGGFLGQKVLLFGLGIACYLHHRDRSRRAMLAAAALGAIQLLIEGPTLLIPLAIWAATYATLGTRSPIYRALSSRVIVYAGARTYSVYLLHMLPLYLGCYALNALGLPSGAYSAALAGITIVATFALSEVAYRSVELPGMGMGARLARGEPAFNYRVRT